MPMNNSQLSSMWGGMPGRSMPMGGRGMMEVGIIDFFEEGVLDFLKREERGCFETSEKMSQD